MCMTFTNPEKRHMIMAAIKGKDTKPEMIVRKELWKRGYRYRVNVRRLPGSPDIVLTKYHTVIFVNGCFWHGHEGCPKYTVPKTNIAFWEEKVRRNKARDAVSIARLEGLGWTVITIWECELSKSRSGGASRFDATLTRIEAEIHAGERNWRERQARRRADRAFAIAEDRQRKAIRAAWETELREEFSINIPSCVVKLSKDFSE